MDWVPELLGVGEKGHVLFGYSQMATMKNEQSCS